MKSEESTSILLPFFTSLAAGFTLFIWVRPRRLTLRQMVTPEQLTPLAMQMPQGEREFILSALEWVNKNIAYQSLASDIRFYDSNVRCRDCSTPAETLSKGMGNCLSQAVLLTSLLRNRLPASRVYTAIGDVALNGLGGHAWVVSQEDSSWFIADPTSGLWAPISHPEYISYAYFNDQEVSCLPGHEICISGRDVVLKKCDCRQRY